MAKGFTIKETDILQLLIEEFNDNVFSDKITFSLGDWILGQNDDGSAKGLLINRLSLNRKGRFDLKESFDESTYAKKDQSFVAMSVGSLNGEFIALNTIKDVVYDTTVEFLVCADNINVQQAITLAIEEIRARFIQYERVLEVSYLNIADMDSSVRTEERLKLIIMSGTIDYGSLVQISGHQYLTYSLPVTIQATNFGEFANQQKIYLGVDSILDSGSVKMFLLEPNEWHYGTASGVESVQLLPIKSETGYTNAKEIKSVLKNKGFSFTADLQMDLQDADVGELLKFLYKRSMQETIDTDIFTLKIETYLYNSSTETFAIDSSLTMTRPMICTQNQPTESLSKGEKIVNKIVLVPRYTTPTTT